MAVQPTCTSHILNTQLIYIDIALRAEYREMRERAELRGAIVLGALEIRAKEELDFGGSP